jgi:hypothetical protein
MLMAEDATPLIEALLAIIDAARAYLPPDGIGKDAFIARVLGATDNPKIIAALAAHDEFEVRPRAPGLIIRQVVAEEVQRFPFPFESGLADRRPTP